MHFAPTVTIAVVVVGVVLHCALGDGPCRESIEFIIGKTITDTQNGVASVGHVSACIARIEAVNLRAICTARLIRSLADVAAIIVILGRRLR